MSDQEIDFEVDEGSAFERTLEGMGKNTYHNVDATQKYLNELGSYSILSADEEYQLALKVQAGDQDATKKMITANLRLVVKIAKRYIRPNVLFSDLIEEGNLGLMHAVEKFEPERGFRISTYATWWIKHYIERSIMNQSRAVRIPVHVGKELNTYLHAGHVLKRTLNREPTHEEIAEKVGRPVEQIQQVLQYNVHSASLDAPVEKASDKPLSDVIANQGPDNPEQSLMWAGVGDLLDGYLDRLPDLERTILNHRFGLGEHDALSLIEVGEIVGLTRERVRQLQSRALKQLAVFMQADRYDFDLESELFDDQQ